VCPRAGRPRRRRHHLDGARARPGPRRLHPRTQTIGADLLFSEHDDLVDFVSDDRLAGSSSGRTFSPLRWSTPLTDYRTVGGRRLATHGDARWGGPDPRESFTYLELTVDDIEYNIKHGAAQRSSPRMKQHQ
jgi:hypothetical protein